MKEQRQCRIVPGAFCNIPQPLSCSYIDCPALLAAARGYYGPAIKFRARYGRIRYLAGELCSIEGAENIDRRHELCDTRVLGMRKAGSGLEASLLPRMSGRDNESGKHNGPGTPNGIVAEEKEKTKET